MRHTSRTLTCLGLAVAATLVRPPAGNAQFDTTGWRFDAQSARVVRYKGREALELLNGVAWLPSVSIEDGTIEFEMALRDTMGFAGARFRMRDLENYEHYYLRAHLSGNPDATQYEPVFNGTSGWQIYIGERFTAPLRFERDTWLHVRLVFEGTRAAVYIDGDTVSQHLPNLLRPPAAGMVGVNASIAPAYFANVRVRRSVDHPVPRRDVPPLPAPAGVVARWAISTPVAEAGVAGRMRLDSSLAERLSWTIAAPTERGIVNLAMHRRRSPEANTVFAALTITSDVRRTVPLRIGFSDRVRAYLNGRLLFAADDGFRTRDYRFLGTVGLFDELYLPLEAGANSLWLAVSESFGGWAVTATLPETPGVRVEPRAR